MAALMAAIHPKPSLGPSPRDPLRTFALLLLFRHPGEGTRMHVHLPKALHGWRELAKEISIIFVGVLIALFFEQLVQRWEMRHKVAAAEAAMQREIFWDDGPEMIQRVSIQPCIDAQLDAIRTAVEASRPRSEIARLVDGLYVPFVTYDYVAEGDASASDVANYMPKDRHNLWTQAYAMIPMVDHTNAVENVDAAKIHALKHNGGPLSGTEQTDLLQGVEAVRADGVRMMTGINWTMEVLPALHGTFDKSRTDVGMRDARLHYGKCIRDVPADWPRTELPPLPKGLAPGVLFDAKGVT